MALSKNRIKYIRSLELKKNRTADKVFLAEDVYKRQAEGVNDYKLKIESLIGKSHVSGDW